MYPESTAPKSGPWRQVFVVGVEKAATLNKIDGGHTDDGFDLKQRGWRSRQEPTRAVTARQGEVFLSTEEWNT